MVFFSSNCTDISVSSFYPLKINIVGRHVVARQNFKWVYAENRKMNYFYFRVKIFFDCITGILRAIPPSSEGKIAVLFSLHLTVELLTKSLL